MSLFGRLLGRHKPRWDEAWWSYPGSVDDVPTVWSVDLGAVDAAPVADLPVRLDVATEYPIDPQGLPFGGGGGLDKLEEAVRATASSLGGAFVGRVAGGGVCRFTAHLPTRPKEPVDLGADAGRNMDVSAEYDPHWAYVRDRLAPDERQHQLLTDLAVVGVLAEHGDAVRIPRQIAHIAYFAEPDSAESAAADLRADGFAATVQRDDEGEFALTALRCDPVSPPGLHELTWAVKETVERHGGSYDGWNCAVAT
jgi:Regulator of ribonuclease activity B/Family of unknown function (DUF695)